MLDIELGLDNVTGSPNLGVNGSLTETISTKEGDHVDGRVVVEIQPDSRVIK